MGRRELFGSTKSGAEGPVVVCANDGAGTSSGGCGVNLVG